MKRIGVVFWSGTGNTQTMADAVAAGAKEAGAEVALYNASEFTKELAGEYEGIAFGCPSMGAEVLEESEFQPMWDAVVPVLSHRRIALFGSYGWGDGEWMRSWEAECADRGIQTPWGSVICHETPDALALEACKNLGISLAK